MTNLNMETTRNLNGGATYHCPFGCNVSGGYWKVYGHCLAKRCFKKNKWLNFCWEGAKFCFSTAFTNELCRALNAAGRVGKHAL